MVEENENRENGLVQETPVTPPSPAFEALTENPEGKPPCQWFMNDTSFCEKIKKNVRCGGDIRKCPF